MSGPPRSSAATRPAYHPFDLVWTLVRTDFKTRYHGTAAGFAWALLKPLALVLVLMGVFSFVFGHREAYAAHLVTGILLYDFFTDATKAGLMSLFSKGFLLNRTAAPPWILVVTSVSNAAITLVVVWIVFLAVLAAGGRPPRLWAVPPMILYLVLYCAISIGVALVLSVLFLVYRDLHEVWDLVTHAGFFLAPVIYPLDILPERLHAWLYLWPPTPVIQFMRAVVIDGTLPSARAHVFLVLGSLVVLGAGMFVFRRYRPRIAEYV